MKTIKNIELILEDSYPLEFSIKFTLSSEGRKDIINRVNGKFNSTEEQSILIEKIQNWDKYFSSWEQSVDENIFKDLDSVIYDYHLIATSGEEISIYSVLRFLLKN